MIPKVWSNSTQNIGLFLEGSNYVLGDKGFKDCEQQGMLNIKTQDECEAACNQLGIPIDKLKNNKICFKAGNNMCRQQNSAGAKTSRVCKKEGSLQMHTYM